ncbi:hypothetical protein C8R45DRAFT_1034548 [Mycena sanguinolenta]|nr:hypothetical protein C8R45DRAFT_1034548 [Mycena sanguinolenta]
MRPIVPSRRCSFVSLLITGLWVITYRAHGTAGTNLQDLCWLAQLFGATSFLVRRLRAIPAFQQGFNFTFRSWFDASRPLQWCVMHPFAVSVTRGLVLTPLCVAESNPLAFLAPSR